MRAHCIKNGSLAATSPTSRTSSRTSQELMSADGKTQAHMSLEVSSTMPSRCRPALRLTPHTSLYWKTMFWPRGVGTRKPCAPCAPLKHPSTISPMQPHQHGSTSGSSTCKRFLVGTPSLGPPTSLPLSPSSFVHSSASFSFSVAVSHLSPAESLFQSLAFFLPLRIALLIAAGRCTVLPLREGIQRMDDFGCCGQAMLFPRAHVLLLVEELHAIWVKASWATLAAGPSSAPGSSPSEGHEDYRVGPEAIHQAGNIAYADLLLEHIAGARGFARYAVCPRNMQHLGLKPSRGDDIADRRARMIWSWSFAILDSENGLRSDTW